GNAAALVNLGVAEVETGNVTSGFARFEAVLTQDSANADATDNRLFSAHYISDDPQALVKLHRTWGQGLPELAFDGHENTDPDRPLRVGYVSPDFRRHSVAFFSEPLIVGHDRKQVEVFCYANLSAPDTVTARFRAASQWREIAGLSAEAVAAMIRADRIDVLVDLAGHTHGNRLDVFALGPAPVQVTALGYPDTTGLSAMTARLCDAVTDPPGAEAYATEKLVRLPKGLHCYAAPVDAPAVAPPPCLTKGFVTFGSFNKRAKISEATVAMWADILKAVPTARLLIKAKALTEAETKTALTAEFVRHGVDGARLDVRGWSPADADHLGLYNDVDIALDTYPYNGTTTTCEALWMGVPVITRQGETHAARVGASLLATVGLRDLICGGRDAYVASAIRLAGDHKKLSTERQALRARLQASSLCDAKGYARDVEAAYRALWRAACAR
ncbi:MAG: hypothetical protein JNK21_04110, partial [Rhodospirillaceae bacterium]|nr:hypothetical protein [Rhodospirillaceae bacterium]